MKQLKEFINEGLFDYLKAIKEMGKLSKEISTKAIEELKDKFSSDDINNPDKIKKEIFKFFKESDIIDKYYNESKYLKKIMTLSEFKDNFLKGAEQN